MAGTLTLPDHNEICRVKICDVQLLQLYCPAGLVLSINQKMGQSCGGFSLPIGSIGQANHTLQGFVRMLASKHEIVLSNKAVSSRLVVFADRNFLKAVILSRTF